MMTSLLLIASLGSYTSCIQVSVLLLFYPRFYIKSPYNLIMRYRGFDFVRHRHKNNTIINRIYQAPT